MQTPSTADSAVFGNLPDVMVQELLEQSAGVSKTLTGRVKQLEDQQRVLRERAVSEGVIKKLPDHVPEADGKTVEAVDGSVAVERMAGTEMYAAAAVRVAGYGEEVEPVPPHHLVKVHAAEGLSDGRRINLALMGLLECKLVHESKSDLVLLDGTIFTMVLNAGIGLVMVSDKMGKLADALNSSWLDYGRDAIPALLVSHRVASIPKRSTSANEFERWTTIFDGRETDLSGIATANLILEGGEYSKPLDLPSERLYLGNAPMSAEYRDDLNSLFSAIKVVYFRPHKWSPAYRIELAPRVAHDDTLLERQLALIREQCVNPAMREPYPLYLADRFVRSLSKGMEAVTEAVRSRVTANSENVKLASRYLSPGRTEPYQEVESE